MLDDERHDLVKGEGDVSLRFEALIDSTATARKLVTWASRSRRSPELSEDSSGVDRTDRLSCPRDHYRSAMRRRLDVPHRENDRFEGRLKNMALQGALRGLELATVVARVI